MDRPTIIQDIFYITARILRGTYKGNLFETVL